LAAASSYYLMVSADICQAIAKRLTMFVMRSKVKVTVLNGAETGLLGVRGAQLEAVIAQYFAKPAASPLACWNKMPMWPLHCLEVVSSSI
jgi:folate-binding Fe-S cluster repair protein YgfZ